MFYECGGNVVINRLVMTVQCQMKVVRYAVHSLGKYLFVLVRLKVMSGEETKSKEYCAFTSSKSSNASSTLEGLMLELDFNLSAFLLFEILAFEAAWYSSNTEVLCNKVSFADLAFNPSYPKESPIITHSLTAAAWSKSEILCHVRPSLRKALARGGCASAVATLTSLLPISAWVTDRTAKGGWSSFPMSHLDSITHLFELVLTYQ